jgi:hypothetical protein
VLVRGSGIGAEVVLVWVKNVLATIVVNNGSCLTAKIVTAG